MKLEDMTNPILIDNITNAYFSKNLPNKHTEHTDSFKAGYTKALELVEKVINIEKTDFNILFNEISSKNRCVNLPKKENIYSKDVSNLTHIDIYRILDLYKVTDPCIQHAIKKLLMAGSRGGGKDIEKDIKEATDSLVRYKQMRDEDVKNSN